MGATSAVLLSRLGETDGVTMHWLPVAAAFVVAVIAILRALRGQ